MFGADPSGGMSALRRSASISVVLLSVIGSLAVLKILGHVMTPLVVAFFMTILLHSAVERITDRSQHLIDRIRHRGDRKQGGELNRHLLAVVATVIVVLSFAAIFLLLYYLVRGQIAMLASQGENIANQVSRTLYRMLRELPFMTESSEGVQGQLDELLSGAWRAVPLAAGTVIQSVINFFWILFLTLFLLLGRARLRARIEETVSEKRFEKASRLMTEI